MRQAISQRRCTLRHARAAAQTHSGGEIESLKTNKIIGELFLSARLGSALCDRCIATRSFYVLWKAYQALSLLHERRILLVADAAHVFVRVDGPPPPPGINSPRMRWTQESISATRFARNGDTNSHLSPAASSKTEIYALARAGREESRKRREKEREGGIRTAVWSHVRHPINPDKVSYRNAALASRN